VTVAFWGRGARVFLSRYPTDELVHPRVTRCAGLERPWMVVPRARPPIPPPEVRHDHSMVVPSGIPGQVWVIEWTGEQVSRHRVHLTP
jgi:hypothetical protein